MSENCPSSSVQKSHGKAPASGFLSGITVSLSSFGIALRYALRSLEVLQNLLEAQSRVWLLWRVAADLGQRNGVRASQPFQLYALDNKRCTPAKEPAALPPADLPEVREFNPGSGNRDRGEEGFWHPFGDAPTNARAARTSPRRLRCAGLF